MFLKKKVNIYINSLAQVEEFMPNKKTQENTV